MATRKFIPVETIGKRIARLRSGLGWTQQNLAERLAISRVAVSHIEMDLSLPSERTLTLLAGLFKIQPHMLVQGSTYPQAKADKLPGTVCCYTELEMDLALLDNDLAWLQRISGSDQHCRLCFEIYQNWSDRLEEWSQQEIVKGELKKITAAQEKLAAVYESTKP